MSKPLTVIARFHAKKGKTALLRKELRRLVKPTRAEAGCINYDLHQSNDNPALFVFHENWESEAALAAHTRSAHLQAARKLFPKLVQGAPDVTKWTMLK